MRQQDANRSETLNSLVKRADADRERMAEESKRLNERLQLAANEATKSSAEREQRLKDELLQKYDSVMRNVKSQFDSRLSYESDIQKRNDDRWRAQTQLTEEMRKLLQQDRGKSKDRFQKVNEALLALEQHLDAGNKKIDKIVNAEIQSRFVSGDNAYQILVMIVGSYMNVAC